MKSFIPDIYSVYYNTKDFASVYVSQANWSTKAAVIAQTFNGDKIILKECEANDEANAYLLHIINE